MESTYCLCSDEAHARQMELYQIAKGPQALCEVETHLPIGTPQCTGSQTKPIIKRGTGDCEAEYVARNEKAFTGRNH